MKHYTGKCFLKICLCTVKSGATWQIAHGNDDDRNHKHKGGGEKNKVSKN